MPLMKFRIDSKGRRKPTVQEYDCFDRMVLRMSLPHLVIIRENPSTQDPHEPATPAMLYPRGGINVCLGL